MNMDKIISCLRDAEQERYDEEERINKRFKATDSFMMRIPGGKRVNAVNYANVMAYCRIKAIAYYSPKPFAESIHKAIHATVNELPEDRAEHLSPIDYYGHCGFSACGMSHTFDNVVRVVKLEHERRLRIFARL